MRKKRKQNSKAETARDAALGYTTLALTMVCFLIILSAVIMATRFVAGLTPATTNTPTQTTVVTTVGTRS